MKLVWFDDPRQLVDDKQFLQFWPNSNQSPEDRINAASRFIIYASSLLYLIRRDARIFIFEHARARSMLDFFIKVIKP